VLIKCYYVHGIIYISKVIKCNHFIYAGDLHHDYDFNANTRKRAVEHSISYLIYCIYFRQKVYFKYHQFLPTTVHTVCNTTQEGQPCCDPYTITALKLIVSSSHCDWITALRERHLSEYISPRPISYWQNCFTSTTSRRCELNRGHPADIVDQNGLLRPDTLRWLNTHDSSTHANAFTV